ncbi:proline-rich protein PRCC [Cataglyphis hispanica]|uniref:proline-rich protein PRCC n=1 Tax=Cataglyphis hispanica TaxID=1086592 RepID=UPI0021800AE1|nr:proline-rich protein PRCC [Cataglyphis hispanica]
MSLVAYDSSDEDSENEGKFKDEKEENDDTEHNVKDLLNMLPKPRNLSSAKNIKENEDDILLQNKTENQFIKPTKKQTVKISVPSLSEFKDLEEEREEKPAKMIQSSQKGCGLFAILGAPKHETTRKPLIPQTVKNATARANIQQSEITRKSSTSQNDSKIKKQTLDKSNESSFDDDEEDTSVDFFGLDTNKNILDNSVSALLDLELSSDDLIYKSSAKEASLVKHIDHTIHNSSSINSDILTNNQSSNSSKTLTSNVINLPKEEILLKNKAEVGPKLPVPEQEYNVDMQGNVAFDEKAIEYLCGKRGTKRKEMTTSDIIEINGEDIKPDQREWLVKALTEEPVQRPVSMQSCGINSQSKKKHQITYLAHQAKAMELELKNQWSQNRMARKQTKSKYGF